MMRNADTHTAPFVDGVERQRITASVVIGKRPAPRSWPYRSSFEHGHNLDLETNSPSAAAVARGGIDGCGRPIPQALRTRITGSRTMGVRGPGASLAQPSRVGHHAGRDPPGEPAR